MTGEGSTSNVDKTYNWRKLSAKQVEAIRKMELMLMSLSGEQDDFCPSAPKFLLNVPGLNTKYEVKSCDSEFYYRFKKALFH